ncbi:Sec23/Sec24 trunk domain containing protein [Histomonas meleagridis]|uniref:Sec23/Sec24 trunk domain containing protein n=1 Tax=Histomonas meleagridis TaxID=135588 RepID=UPI00355AAED5|nr:Sec23/Sec24 trunk domain containing protein [Histomonas meleagridis]KAH0803492.1 Sec23/Sec24 trunk domain containing protein [Histomonas meleagridis]
MRPRRYKNPEMETNQQPPPPVTNTTLPSTNVVPNAVENRAQITFPWANPNLLTPNLPQGTSPFLPYFRTVTPIFPSSKEVAAQAKVPLGLIISPALVDGVQEIDSTQENVTRCTTCLAYLCPQCKVSPNGREWICAICGKANPIISKSYSMVPFAARPEFSASVYQYIAPKPYIHINSGPVFLFLVDMSYNTYATGLTTQMLNSIKASLPDIPDHYRLGLMTMANTVSVYDLKSQSEIIIADPDEANQIVLPNLFQTKAKCRESLEAILDSLISKVPDINIPGHCLGSAYLVISKIMQGTGGIVLASFTGLPVYGHAKLKSRQANDELSLLKLPPDGSGKFYREVAFALNRACVSVHIFTAGNEFKDLSTVAVPSGLTCGECHHYGVLDEAQLAKMHSDIYGTLMDSYCWDSSVRLRCSTGIKISRPFTNCIISQDLVSFPVIARENSIAYGIEVEGNVSNAIFQLSFIFTDSNCRRMIRIFTFTSPLSNSPQTIGSCIDEAALVTFISRKAATAVLSTGPSEASVTLRKNMSQIFFNRIQVSSAYHLLHSLLCCSTIRPAQHPLGVDGRMSELIRLRSIDLTDLIIYLYPRMFVTDAEQIMVLPLTGQSFAAGHCFLVHTVDKIYIWLSSEVTPEYLQNAFGVSSFDKVAEQLPKLETKENQQLQQLLTECWELSGRYLPVEVIPQGNPKEAIFGEILVDDSAACGAPLQQWMKEFQAI